MVVGALIAAGASVTAGLFVIQVAVIPLIFKYSKLVQRKIVFSNCINYPRNMDYENPSSCDIIGGRNFYVNFFSKADNCNVKLGAWHMIPRSLYREVFVIRDCAKVDQRLFNELAITKKPVVLYCHGNSNHRASPHRLQMYKMFQGLNFHVITFDYRGYGDSTKIRPTEAGVVEDLLQTYAWLRRVVDKGKQTPLVFVWGHSLGTAVAAHMSANLDRLCEKTLLGKNLPQPDALILEAPFNNLKEEIEKHPCSKLVNWLPYYSHMFIKPFVTSPEYAFTTDEYLAKVKDIPILMLHSKCDRIVPFDLAIKLQETIQESRRSGGAPLVTHYYDKCFGLGHNNICESPDLPVVVENFVEVVKRNIASHTPEDVKRPTSAEKINKNGVGKWLMDLGKKLSSKESNVGAKSPDNIFKAEWERTSSDFLRKPSEECFGSLTSQPSVLIDVNQDLEAAALPY